MLAAFFDVDGTLASSNVVICHMDFQRWRLGRWRYLAWLGLLLTRAPYYLALDVISRSKFNEAFCHSYRGVPLAQAEAWGKHAIDLFWPQRIYQEAQAKVKEHRGRGHRIVLLSGGMEPVLKPLAQLISADFLLCNKVALQDPRHYRGQLEGSPLSGEAKAVAAEALASREGLDLSQCYAYADSYSDRWLLERVGHPAAVNPDKRLQRLARRQGWPVLRWRTLS